MEVAVRSRWWRRLRWYPVDVGELVGRGGGGGLTEPSVPAARRVLHQAMAQTRS